MIFFILYLSYLIIDFTYNDNKKNQYIEEIVKLNTEIKDSLVKWEEIINYKASKAYINKIRKEEQGEKWEWELVVYLTTQEKYNKFTKIKEEINKENIVIETDNQNNIKEMTIYQKWIYFIFRKDSSL